MRPIRACFPSTKLAAALVFTVALGCGNGLAADATPVDTAREDLAAATATLAYVYGFPVVEMARVRYRRTADPKNPERRPPNTFSHRRRLSNHTDTVVVAPNNDTLYSSAWLDLSQGPVLLGVPDMRDRYYAFQLIDAYTNTFGVVGKRTHGTSGARVAIVGPEWKGALPDDLQILRSPTPWAWLIGRILVDGEADLPNVHALQDQLSLTATPGTPTGGASALAGPPADLAEPLRFFALMNAALRMNPPPTEERALMGLFDEIGVGPAQEFRTDRLDAATLRGLERGAQEGRRIVADLDVSGGHVAGGWKLPPKGFGVFGNRYALRAFMARVGLGALPETEAVYLTADRDIQGRPLDGRRRYVLRMQADGLPPVAGFWSLTLYRLPSHTLAENSQRRYAVGDRSANLSFGADGSLEILVQHDPPPPEREANWLPAPEGEFELTLRAYLPQVDFHSGAWQPPAIVPVE